MHHPPLTHPYEMHRLQCLDYAVSSVAYRAMSLRGRLWLSTFARWTLDGATRSGKVLRVGALFMRPSEHLSLGECELTQRMIHQVLHQLGH